MIPGETERSEVVHRGRRITVLRDRVRLEDGELHERDVVRHPGAVAIVPVLPDGRIVMLRQWRHAVNKVLVEIPAGTLEPGEDPRECARRELAEETGYRAGSLERLAVFFTAPGFCDELMHLYRAGDLEPGELDLDPGERLEPWTATPRELRRRIAAGEVEDAKTLVGLLMVLGPEEGADG